MAPSIAHPQFVCVVILVLFAYSAYSYDCDSTCDQKNSMKSSDFPCGFSWRGIKWCEGATYSIDDPVTQAACQLEKQTDCARRDAQKRLLKIRDDASKSIPKARDDAVRPLKQALGDLARDVRHTPQKLKPQ